MQENNLGHPPRHSISVYGNREVHEVGRFPVGVDIAPVRQPFSEGAEQKAPVPHGQEVRAVDPDQVHTSTAVAAGRLLGHDPRHRLRRVIELGVLDVHAIALGRQITDPGDEGIRLRVASPGVEIDLLATGGIDDLLPSPVLLRGCGLH
jgi:hypothetical protein